MDLAVSVDATGDSARLLRWSCHPFLSLTRLRGGTAVPRRMTVRSVCCEQTGHSPLWNGARRVSIDLPRAPVDGAWTP